MGTYFRTFATDLGFLGSLWLCVIEIDKRPDQELRQGFLGLMLKPKGHSAEGGRCPAGCLSGAAAGTVREGCMSARMPCLFFLPMAMRGPGTCLVGLRGRCYSVRPPGRSIVVNSGLCAHGDVAVEGLGEVLWWKNCLSHFSPGHPECK